MDYFKYLQQRQQPQPPQVPFSPAQGMATQQPQMPQQGPMVPNSPMAPAQEQIDPALRAMLELESLSPAEKQRARKQAQIDQLRDLALGGGARHWTGVLAQGLAGGLSGYQQRKLDPEYEKGNEERRKRMRDIFGTL